MRVRSESRVLGVRIAMPAQKGFAVGAYLPNHVDSSWTIGEINPILVAAGPSRCLRDDGEPLSNAAIITDTYATGIQITTGSLNYSQLHVNFFDNWPACS